MARLHNIIGTGRGRLGNTVLCKGDNGQTIARAHQPQVRNPRSIEQRKQRAKMNLAGQFAKLIDTDFLSCMGMGNNRDNRSAFVSNIIKKATVSVDASDINKYNAVIAGEDVNFSNGSYVGYGKIEYNPYVQSTQCTVMVSYPDVSFPDPAASIPGDRFFLAALGTGNFVDFVLCKDTIYDGQALRDHIVFTFGQPLSVNQQIMIWQVPFLLNAKASSLTGQTPDISSDNITAALLSHSNSSGIEWGITKFIGTFTCREG